MTVVELHKDFKEGFYERVPDTRSSDTGRSIAGRNRRTFCWIPDGGTSSTAGCGCCSDTGGSTVRSSSSQRTRRRSQRKRRRSNRTVVASNAPHRCGTRTSRKDSRATSIRRRWRAILPCGCCILQSSHIVSHSIAVHSIFTDVDYPENSWGCWTDSGTRNRPACWRNGCRRDMYSAPRHIRLHLQQYIIFKFIIINKKKQ